MKIIIATVGPLASASANNISTSQTPPGAFAAVINGTLAVGATANNIAASQSAVGAADLVIDGSLAISGVAYLATPGSVTITSAANDTGITFTVYGLAYNANGGPFGVVETVTGSNTSTVATINKFHRVTRVATSGATAGNVTVGTNGVAVLDKARRVLITSAGNDSNKTFTVTGTDWNGNIVSETITGGNVAAVATTRDFLTVTSIVPSAATAGAITVGTNGVASTRPIILDEYAVAPTTLQINVTGTVNYTVQSTLDDPGVVAWSDIVWVDSADAAVVGATANKMSSFAYVPKMTRVLLNSGSGTVKYTVLQAGSITGV